MVHKVVLVACEILEQKECLFSYSVVYMHARAHNSVPAIIRFFQQPVCREEEKERERKRASSCGEKPTN